MDNDRNISENITYTPDISYRHSLFSSACNEHIVSQKWKVIFLLQSFFLRCVLLLSHRVTLKAQKQNSRGYKMS